MCLLELIIKFCVVILAVTGELIFAVGPFFLKLRTLD